MVCCLKLNLCTIECSTDFSQNIQKGCSKISTAISFCRLGAKVSTEIVLQTRLRNFHARNILFHMVTEKNFQQNFPTRWWPPQLSRLPRSKHVIPKSGWRLSACAPTKQAVPAHLPQEMFTSCAGPVAIVSWTHFSALKWTSSSAILRPISFANLVL